MAVVELDEPPAVTAMMTPATALKGKSVSLAWKESRSQWARRINAMLVRRDPTVERLIAASEKRRAHIKKQLENIIRSN